MPAIGDVIELVHEQSYLGQTINNVYYYQDSVGSTPLTTLATWYETNVVPAIQAFQNDLVTHVNLRLRNLFDLGETYEEPLTGTGTNASGLTELPAFFCLQIRLDHPTGDIRPGFKRYTGLIEASVIDSLVAPATVTQMDTLGALLVNPPSVALTGYVHVVVKRICETPNPTPGAVPSCLKYRLPETLLEAEVAYPDSFESYVQPTTQNSRKYYT